MQNVESLSSCSSKLFEASGRWLFDLALGCEVPLATICWPPFSWFATPLAPNLNSYCSWLAIPFVLGLLLLLFLVRAPLVFNSQLLLLLVYNSS
jgi:hypothetical protein